MVVDENFENYKKEALQQLKQLKKKEVKAKNSSKEIMNVMMEQQQPKIGDQEQLHTLEQQQELDDVTGTLNAHLKPYKTKEIPVKIEDAWQQKSDQFNTPVFQENKFQSGQISNIDNEPQNPSLYMDNDGEPEFQVGYQQKKQTSIPKHKMDLQLTDNLNSQQDDYYNNQIEILEDYNQVQVDQTEKEIEKESYNHTVKLDLPRGTNVNARRTTSAKKEIDPNNKFASLFDQSESDRISNKANFSFDTINLQSINSSIDQSLLHNQSYDRASIISSNDTQMKSSLYYLKNQNRTLIQSNRQLQKKVKQQEQELQEKNQIIEELSSFEQMSNLLKKENAQLKKALEEKERQLHELTKENPLVGPKNINKYQVQPKVLNQQDVNLTESQLNEDFRQSKIQTSQKTQKQNVVQSSNVMLNSGVSQNTDQTITYKVNRENDHMKFSDTNNFTKSAMLLQEEIQDKIDKEQPFNTVSQQFNYNKKNVTNAIGITRPPNSRFKFSCLKPKHMIYNDKKVQIGCISELMTVQQQTKLKIKLYLTNLTKQLISDFKFELDGQESKIFYCFQFFQGMQNVQIWINNMPDSLETKSQKKAEVLVDFTDVPYQMINIQLSYKINDQQFRDQLYLPMTINKFMMFEEEMDTQQVKYVKSSAEIKYNKKLFKNTGSLKKYFPKLTKIKVGSQSQQSFGGNFYLPDMLEKQNQYQVFITFENKSTLYIEIGYNNKTLENRADYMLSTLMYLFQA